MNVRINLEGTEFEVTVDGELVASGYCDRVEETSLVHEDGSRAVWLVSGNGRTIVYAHEVVREGEE